MFITALVAAQILFFLMIFVLERFYPYNKWQEQEGFNAVLCLSISIGAMFAQVIFFYWVNIKGIGLQINSNPLIEGAIFYVVYSFVNYWMHRVKHAMPLAWKYLHIMHHGPSHMDSRVAFYRHPFEMVANAIILFLLGKVVLNVSAEAVAMALVIEGILETFHHSNLKIPRFIRPLGYVIQIPEQHIVHHLRGVHRYNYSPISLWDCIFGTMKFHQKSNNELGFKHSKKAWKYLRFDK